MANNSLRNKRIFMRSETNSKYYLIGTKCEVCGRHTFPSKRVCPWCGEEKMKEVTLSTRGNVYTYTIVRQAPKGFRPPYATLYVDLPEGVRVFAQSDLMRWKDGTPKIGSEVELVIDVVGVDEKGNEVLGIKFNPVQTDRN